MSALNNTKMQNTGLSQPTELKPDFNGVPTQALDAVRMRLAQLTSSLKKIRDELAKPDLPQWHSLQSQLNVTLTQLQSVTTTLEHFRETLDSTVVYPLPNFPTTSHENLLTTLLRKKYTPEVDEWFKKAKENCDIDFTSVTEEKINDIIQTDKKITDWALEIFSKAFETNGALSSSENNDTESSTSLVEEKNKNHYKPKKPFEINSILSYIYNGNNNDAQGTNNVPV